MTKTRDSENKNMAVDGKRCQFSVLKSWVCGSEVRVFTKCDKTLFKSHFKISSIFDKCPDIVITSILAKPYILWKSLFHWIGWQKTVSIFCLEEPSLRERSVGVHGVSQKPSEITFENVLISNFVCFKGRIEIELVFADLMSTNQDCIITNKQTKLICIDFRGRTFSV